MDYFKGDSGIDRNRGRAMTEAERGELKRLIDDRERHNKKFSLVMTLLIGLLLAIRESSYDSEPLRRLVLAFSAANSFCQPVRWWEGLNHAFRGNHRWKGQARKGAAW
jgi:hypothetical protein